MKLHLGCGKRYISGFVHIDLADYAHIDYNHNVARLAYIEDSSVDHIYASHVLEYFTKQEAIDVLIEWRRVLKTGGLLRIAVPDFEALTSLYLQNKNYISLISGVLYGYMNIKGGIGHKVCYDETSLSNLLISCDFKDIKRWDWRQVPKNDLPEDDWAKSYVPHMDFENGKLISLNIECFK